MSEVNPYSLCLASCLGFHMTPSQWWLSHWHSLCPWLQWLWQSESQGTCLEYKKKIPRPSYCVWLTRWGSRGSWEPQRKPDLGLSQHQKKKRNTKLRAEEPHPQYKFTKRLNTPEPRTSCGHQMTKLSSVMLSAYWGNRNCIRHISLSSRQDPPTHTHIFMEKETGQRQ